MSTKKLFPSRADLRGGVEGGLFDRAVVTSRTHSNFDTSGLTLGVNDRLVIEFDGGANSATVNLFNAAGLTAEELVSLINAAFLAVGTVAFKFRGGRVQIRSPRGGVESQVDVSGSDADVLNLLLFDQTNVTGRTFESTQENPGLEDNDVRTRLAGLKEPLIREVTNRSPLALATHLDRIQGLLNTELAIPRTFKPAGADTVTMDDLGAPRGLLVSILTDVPQVGELVTGVTSGATATVLNTVTVSGAQYLVVLPVAGTFQAGGETLDGEGGRTGPAFATYDDITLVDDRVRAIRMPDRTYVGSTDYFGGAPTADQLEQLFGITVYKESSGNSTVRNTPTESTYVTQVLPVLGGSLSVPSYTSGRVRVREVTQGVPDECYSPTNTYTHTGIERHVVTDVDSWTKNRIFPSGGVVANVLPGDIALITGSSDSGVELNTGNYAIREVGTDYYEIGPSKPANSSLPEGTLLDAEIFEDSAPALSPVPPAKVRVVSPSYYMDQRVDSSAADASCYLFLEEPASPLDTITVVYYEVSSLPDRSVGDPDFESPWARYLQARVDDVENQLQSLSAFGIVRGKLQKDKVLDLGGFSDVVTVRGKGIESSTLYDFAAPSRQQHLNYLDSLSGDRANPQTAPLSAASFLAEDKSALDVGTAHAMDARPIRSDVLCIDYIPNTGTPAAGDIFTGVTSGATATVLSKQAGDQIFVLVTSGVFEAGEDLTAAGPKQIDDVLLRGYEGFRFDLPFVTLGQLATIPAGSDLVTLGGAGLPTYWENIRPGDVFVPLTADLMTAGVAIRIEAVDTGARTLLLEHTQPYDGTTTPFGWAVRPDIGNYRFLRDPSNGATVRAKHPYIEIEVAAGEATPHEFGAAPGDLIRATTDILGGTSTDGTGMDYARIKRLIPQDTAAPTTVMIELEESAAATLTAATDVQWEIIRTHNRTMSLRGASPAAIGQFGENYDAALGGEVWMLCAPAFAYVPVVNYGAPSQGGLVGQSVAGGGDSGLTGKSMTAELWVNGVMESEETITFASDPGSVADLVTTMSGLFTNPWLQIQQVNNSFPAVVFRTVGAAEYTGETFDGNPYYAVGPGVSIHLRGRAWDAMLAGNTPTYGNQSETRHPSAYYERLGHVMTQEDRFPWAWEGIAYLIYPNVELGRDTTVQADPFRSGTALIHANNYNPKPDSSGDKSVQAGVPQAAPIPAIHVESARDWNYQIEEQEALRVSALGQPQASLTISGKGKQREYGHQLNASDGLGRPDSFGGEGERGPGIYSGPVLIKDSWEGHSLAVIITYGARTIRRQVAFTSTDDDLVSIIATIEGMFVSTDYAECVMDQHGTGFIIRINMENLTATAGPFYNNRASIAIDPRGTTIHNFFDNAERIMRLLDKVPTRNQTAPLLSGLTSAGETRAAAGGLVKHRGGGRRLIVPRFRDNMAAEPGALPAMEEVVWDEVAGSLQPVLEMREGKDSAMTPLLSMGHVFPMEQMESLLFYGGRQPGAAQVLLYQFISGAPEGAFTLGEELEYTDHTSPALGGRARLVSQYAANGSVVSIGDSSFIEIKGYTVELAAVEESEAFHAGGSLVRGLTSGKSGVFHPVIIQVENAVNDPGFSEGDQLNCTSNPNHGQAVGYYAGQFNDGIYDYYVVYGSTDKWTQTIAIAGDPHQTVWRGSLKSAAAGAGTFDADIVDVIYLDSMVASGGPLRPVAAMSYKNLHANRKDRNTPAITSFGDMQVLDGGEYLWAERVPGGDNWPTEIRDGSLKNAILPVGRFLPHGRTFTTEVLAEGGQYAIPFTATESFPDEDSIGARNVTLFTSAVEPATLRFQNSSFPAEVAWFPFPPTALGSATEKYNPIVFHVPIPHGLVWIEGFGAYVKHESVEERDPFILALYSVDGLTKTATYIHRIEVDDTGTTPIQVDSAGGSTPQSQGVVQTGFKPPWADAWDPFEPFPMFLGKNSRSVELYIDEVAGTKVPAPGDKIWAGTYPSPAGGATGRQAGVAYVEKFGLRSGADETTTAYRVLLHIGAATAGTTGYPVAKGSSVVTTPSDIVEIPEDMFFPGDNVTWKLSDDTGDTGTGVVRAVNRYPHGDNLRLVAYVNAYRDLADSSDYLDELLGVYVRYRCQSVDLSRI